MNDAFLKQLNDNFTSIREALYILMEENREIRRRLDALEELGDGK